MRTGTKRYQSISAIGNYARKDFKDHVVTSLGTGSWSFATPGTSNMRMFINELPDGNLVISGDAGETLFKMYRGLEWLNGVTDRLLSDDAASWSYIHEKTGNCETQLQFNLNAVQNAKDAVDAEIARTQCDCDLSPHDAECRKDNCDCEDDVCECIDAWACDCERGEHECDLGHYVKLKFWWKENGSQIEDWQDETSMYAAMNVLEYPEEEMESWPRMNEYSFGFIHRMYGAAMFFKELGLGPTGAIKGSLYERKLEVEAKEEKLAKLKKDRKEALPVVAVTLTLLFLFFMFGIPHS